MTDGGEPVAAFVCCANAAAGARAAAAIVPAACLTNRRLDVETVIVVSSRLV
jgi:hypothetical protein